MTEQGVLSPDGSCKTFSADADGYARGEAISAIYIKPLDVALRDGNPVRAVIRATATNSDGRTPGITYPSTEAHEAMMRKAYDIAGITDFSTTTFVECHGTGTPTGDPIVSKFSEQIANLPARFASSESLFCFKERAFGLNQVSKLAKTHLALLYF